MPYKHNWLPGSRVLQLAMARRWMEILAQMAGIWGVPASELLALGALIAIAADCLLTIQSLERTAVNTAKCNEAFDALIEKMRFIKNRYFLSPPLTAADFISLGLKPQDTNPTEIPPPKNHPGVEVVKWAPHTLGLRLFTAIDMGDVEADHGFRVYYGLVAPGAPASVDGKLSATRLAGDVYALSSPPGTQEDLPNSFFTRRAKDTLVLPLEATGYTCYLSALFENGKGDKGQWGEMIHALVP